jgi:type I restriction enzyme S subunit
MEKVKNKPLLRFPEFENDWQLKKIGTLTNRISNPVKIQSHELYKQIGIRSHGKGIFYKEAVTGKELGNKRVFWIKENTFIVNIVFAWEQAVAKTTVNEIGMVASHRFPMYASAEMQSNHDYLLHFFLTPKGKTLLELASPGGAGRNKTLGQKEFENLKFLIPGIDEQRKISDFLTAIDNKIIQLKQKKILLERYKKGVMQKLFSQELRFKDEDGKEFPKWEKKKLADVAKNIMYGMNAAAIPFDGENKYIRITDIDDNSRRFMPNPLCSPDGEMEEKYKLKEGDILFVRTGASVGKSYLYNRNDGNVLFAGFLIKFSIINANPNFIFIQTLLESYNKWVLMMSMRSGQPGINAEEYKIFPIQIPCMEEQTKIANFLSAIDEKINRTENQIQKTQEWKKGLLQRMFV